MDIKKFARERLRDSHSVAQDDDFAQSCVGCNDDISLAEAVRGYEYCKFCRSRLGVEEKIDKIDDKVRMAFNKLITDSIIRATDSYLKKNAAISEDELINLVADEVVRGYPHHEVMIRYRVEQVITQYFDETRRMAF